jgi:hypothetical protein
LFAEVSEKQDDLLHFKVFAVNQDQKKVIEGKLMFQLF